MKFYDVGLVILLIIAAACVIGGALCGYVWYIDPSCDLFCC